MKKEVIAHKDPKSPISEVFRTLRTNIQFMSNSKKMKTLLVTSTFPGEGKSWVTSNLAVTFAQAGKRVVIIDADMRKGREYAIFGVAPRLGLSNLLSEWDEDTDSPEDILNYIQATEVDNLFVITAGNVPPNPSELLVSGKMKRVLEELKQVCDLIIIDGTPCELVTDSVILSRIVDTTIIVTAHKITKKDALQRVVKNIQNVGGNLAGVVINKVPISSRRYGEKYYYYGHDSSLGGAVKPNKKDVAKMNSEFNQRRVLDTLQRDRMPKEKLIEREESRKKASQNDAQRRPYNEKRTSIENSAKRPEQNRYGNGENTQKRAEQGRYNNLENVQKRQEQSGNYMEDGIKRQEQARNREENFQKKCENQNSSQKSDRSDFANRTESSTNSSISFDKTNDILKQINEYLENEKKNLN